MPRWNPQNVVKTLTTTLWVSEEGQYCLWRVAVDATMNHLFIKWYWVEGSVASNCCTMALRKPTLPSELLRMCLLPTFCGICIFLLVLVCVLFRLIFSSFWGPRVNFIRSDFYNLENARLHVCCGLCV